MSFSMKMLLGILVVTLIELISQTVAEYCSSYGHTCLENQRCCGATCCVPEGYEDRYHHGGFEWSVMNMWYFWFIVIFILMSCFGGCGYWRRRQLLLAQHQQSMGEPVTFGAFMGTGRRYRRPCSTTITVPVFPYESSVSSVIPGPPPPSAASDVPAQGTFPSPPPYSEVVSKPEVFLPSKDELPPYPGEPVITADDQDPTRMPVQPLSSVPGPDFVPGLPPYSLTDPSNAIPQVPPASVQHSQRRPDTQDDANQDVTINIQGAAASP